MQVEINHPHAEAIAAYFNGRRIRAKGTTHWFKLEPMVDHPFFQATEGYDIEPEVVTKYCLLTVSESTGITHIESTYAPRSIHQLNFQERHRHDAVCKKTYTDGVLTALELVEINNV